MYLSSMSLRDIWGAQVVAIILRSIQQDSWGPTNCLVSRLRPLKDTCNINLLYPYMNPAPHSHKSGHQVPRNSASDIDQRTAPQGIAKVIGFKEKSVWWGRLLYCHAVMDLYVEQHSDSPSWWDMRWMKQGQWIAFLMCRLFGIWWRQLWHIQNFGSDKHVVYMYFLSQTVLHTWNIFTHK